MRRIIAASSDIFLLWPTFCHIINLIRVINTRLIRMLEFYSHRVQIFRGRDRTTAATGTGTATTATGPGTATTCNTSKYLTHSLNLKTKITGDPLFFLRRPLIFFSVDPLFKSLSNKIPQNTLKYLKIPNSLWKQKSPATPYFFLRRPLIFFSCFQIERVS